MQIAAAIAILEDILPECGDDDIVMLWCQAQERLAGLERLLTPRGIRLVKGAAASRATTFKTA